jgi:NAD(P)H-hydrate epimerase
VHRALTTAQMRDAEAAAVAHGKPLAELMERAGAAVAAHVLGRPGDEHIVVLCGGGNNGGDGWVAARLLFEAGRRVTVVSVVEAQRLPEPAASAAARAIAAGVRWALSAQDPDVSHAGVIVDALLGSGAHGAPRDEYARLIGSLCRTRAHVVAVDLPSGVDADTGAVAGVAVSADVTVTFGAPKLGCVLQPGASFAGTLVVADIGIESRSMQPSGAPEVWDAEDYARLLPLPRWNDTKRTRGRVLVVGGSPGMTGAICLAAMGALRAGAGYVTVAAPAVSLPVIEAKLTAPVKLPLPSGGDGSLTPESGAAVAEAATHADAVVMGPGMGRSAGSIAAVLAAVRSVRTPLVMDADALFALGGDLNELAERTGPTIITPHEGEAAGLLGRDPEGVAAGRMGAARGLQVGDAVAVLKGPSTLIAGPQRMAVNRTGGPGLASLGTGDVLSGVIGALVAAGLPPFDAALLGTYLHGAAGDLAARDLTPLSMTAEDVVAYLPRAVRHLLEIRERINEED